MNAHRIKVLAAALLTAALTGCTTFYDVYFVPAPLEVRIGDGEDPTGLARALLAVQGVRRPVAEQGQPARFELKLRFENIGATPLEIEPDSFELVSADLQPCGAAQLVQTIDHPLAAGEAIDLDLFVPLPAGKTIDDFDLRGLNLTWAVRFANRRIVTGVSFQRYFAPPYYYYDPFYSSWHYGCSTHVGIGVFHAY
jgi:hypothetical protein